MMSKPEEEKRCTQTLCTELNFGLNWENSSLSEKSLCSITCMHLIYVLLCVLQYFLLASEIYSY